MSVVRITKINKTYGPLTILSGISFVLDRGQKAVLVGANGTGKTTLLKIIAGLEELDNGKIEIARTAKVGYLPQDASLIGDYTVADYLRKEMGEGGSDHRWQIMLSGFGLEEKIGEKKLSNLSSGQKTKVMLAGVLLKGADLLLLDEPTNNLDLPALIWLENFLQNSEAAALIVSHDRRFLDKVARKIFVLDQETRTLTVTGGTYSAYLEMEVKRLNRRKLEYRLQQQEIERLSTLAREKRVAAEEGSRWMGSDNDKLLRGFKRDRAKGSTRVARVIERRIDRMEKIDNPEERNPLELGIKADTERGELDLEITNLVAGYNSGFKIGPLSLDIRFGKRVAILGLNGSGKSTLLKTISGELSPLEGVMTLGSGVRIGNMMQEHETLPKDKTLLEFLKSKTNLRVQDIYNKLLKFNFNEEQLKQPISTLSPGGRARLLLALFSAEGVNMLILDEPTNHLDLEAIEALEETLSVYEGTVILVSHDRYFIEKAKLDYVYILKDGQLEKLSDYSEYIIEAQSKAERLTKYFNNI